MKIVFLPSAARDVAWFRHYYTAVFPEGQQKAGTQLKRTQGLLAMNPYIGHPSEHVADAREVRLSRTPFTLIYVVRPEQIEVLRLWDERQGGAT